MQVNFLIIIAQKERNSMAIRYYWGRPKDVIRWYLRGTLYLSAQSRKSYIEKIGAAPGNLTRLLKLLMRYLIQSILTA